MKISYTLGFLLALSLPAAAAEPDQNLKQEVGKIASAYEQNFNKKDAAGITSLYTKNYLRVQGRPSPSRDCEPRRRRLTTCPWRPSSSILQNLIFGTHRGILLRRLPK